MNISQRTQATAKTFPYTSFNRSDVLEKCEPVSLKARIEVVTVVPDVAPNFSVVALAMINLFLGQFFVHGRVGKIGGTVTFVGGGLDGLCTQQRINYNKNCSEVYGHCLW